MDAATLAEFKSQLEQLEHELVQAVKADEGTDKVELDQSRMGRLSRMDALQNQQISLDKQRRRQHHLKAVEGAFRRLEQGQFGQCFICDEPISLERLRFAPILTRCIDCAEA